MQATFDAHYLLLLLGGSRVLATFAVAHGEISARVATIWWGLIADKDLQGEPGKPFFRKWEEVNIV